MIPEAASGTPTLRTAPLLPGFPLLLFHAAESLRGQLPPFSSHLPWGSGSPPSLFSCWDCDLPKAPAGSQPGPGLHLAPWAGWAHTSPAGQLQLPWRCGEDTCRTGSPPSLWLVLPQASSFSSHCFWLPSSLAGQAPPKVGRHQLWRGEGPGESRGSDPKPRDGTAGSSPEGWGGGGWGR